MLCRISHGRPKKNPRKDQANYHPIQEINNRLNQAIPPYIRKLNEALDPTIRNLHKALKAHQPFFDQMACTLIKMQEAAYRWQEARKSDVTEMAENGCYPNRFTFFYTPETEPESVDELMRMHVNADWEELAHKIIELCPARKHILENAFNLHKPGNYTAAIPLFLAQADGI